MIYFIIIIAILLFIFLNIQLKNQKEKDRIAKEKAEKLRLENERKRQEAFKFFININKENSSHHENLEYKNGYFSNYKMTIWKYDFKSIHNSHSPALRSLQTSELINSQIPLKPHPLIN
jgi:predicted membrane protein